MRACRKNCFAMTSTLLNRAPVLTIATVVFLALCRYCACDEPPIEPAETGSASVSAAPEPTEPLDEDEFPLAPGRDESVDASTPLCSAWAKFPVGSWARRRTTSVTYEDGKPVQSVTETRVLLKSVDFEKKRYELQYDSTIKLGAIDYPRKSETVAYDFWDVPIDDDAVVEELEPVSLKIGLKAIPCRVRRVVRETDKARETTTVWHSPVVAPYVFERQTVREPKSEDGSFESGATSRELYVVQRLPALTRVGIAPVNYIARSSSIAGSRRLSTTIVFSTSTPGGSLRENTQETRSDDDPTVYQTDSVLLDYYIAR